MSYESDNEEGRAQVPMAEDGRQDALHSGPSIYAEHGDTPGDEASRDGGDSSASEASSEPEVSAESQEAALRNGALEYVV